jgi:hypothetical protein
MFFVQGGDELFIVEIFDDRAVFAGLQSGTQGLKFGFVGFEFAQAGTNDFADRLEAALLQYFSNELIKMLTKGNRGISGH